MHQKRGFSLLELLITMTFVSVIATIITSVYLTGFNTFRQELTTSIVQSDAQTILDNLLLDIKNGMLIEQTYDSWITDEDTIIIRVPAMNSEKQILYSGADMLFDRVVYNYDGSAIHKIIYANPLSTRNNLSGKDITLDSKILALSFIYDPDQATATHVTATIHSEANVGNRNRGINLTGEARLRNHI